MTENPYRPDLTSPIPPTPNELSDETAKRMTELIAQTPDDAVGISKEEFDRAVEESGLV